MSSTQNIAIAAVAGILIVGGGVYVARDSLGLGGGIHSIDFRNTPVEVVGTACADPQLTAAGVTKLPLHDGAYQLGQYQFELVGDVRYGDVSGHTGESTSEKAVFVGSCSTAGKTSQVLFVYGMEDGKPERLASSDLSAAGTSTLVQSYDVSNGAITVKANEGDPPALVTLTYALLNGSLVSLNPANPATIAQTTSAPEAPASGQPAAAQTTGPAVTVSDANMGEDSVNFETFHDALSPYGQWINHSRWGQVWHPTQVPAGFAPYRQGHWEDTDEYGTVWVSDYNWGDIAFHYGRWGYDPSYGWLWQPGYVWSPAWVVWRAGAGDIGWFPIPPDYYDGLGVFVDDWNGWYGYRAWYGAALDAAAFYALWNFIPADDIYAPSIGVDLVAPAVFGGFIGRTAGWTRFGSTRGHLFNRSIDPARFRATFGHPLPVSTRHDFLTNHGPIIGPAQGRLIAARNGLATAGHGNVAFAHHGPVSHFAASRSATGHISAHSTYAHSGYSHSAYAHGFAGTHTRGSVGYAQHSGYRSGSYAQHPAAGSYAQRPVSGSGYAQRPAYGGGMAAHSGMGGGAARSPQTQRSSPTHH
jgi:hypothetical protein